MKVVCLSHGYSVLTNYICKYIVATFNSQLTHSGIPKICDSKEGRIQKIIEGVWIYFILFLLYGEFDLKKIK